MLQLKQKDSQRRRMEDEMNQKESVSSSISMSQIDQDRYNIQNWRDTKHGENLREKEE